MIHCFIIYLIHSFFVRISEIVKGLATDSRFSRQIGGYLNNPLNSHEFVSDFIYFDQAELSIPANSRSYDGALTFNMGNNLGALVNMANLFQTYQVIGWEGYIWPTFGSAYASYTFFWAVVPYNRSPYLMSNSNSLQVIPLGNLPGCTTKIVTGQAAEDGINGGSSVLLHVKNPTYFINSRPGNADTDTGVLPSNQPLILDRRKGRDSTNWQLGLYHLENAGPADTTSITVNVHARATIKFEGVEWDTKTWYSGL